MHSNMNEFMALVRAAGLDEELLAAMSEPVRRLEQLLNELQSQAEELVAHYEQACVAIESI